MANDHSHVRSVPPAADGHKLRAILEVWLDCESFLQAIRLNREADLRRLPNPMGLDQGRRPTESRS